MAKKEQQTFANLTVTHKDNSKESFEFRNEKQTEEIQKEAAAAGDSVEITKGPQSFYITRAESVDEILHVVPKPEVALDYFNYGLTLAQHNVKRDLMKSDWEGQEGVYDLIKDVQEPAEKRVADPMSASRRSLKALFSKLNPGAPEPTDEEINAVLAQFTGAAQAA